MIQPEAEGLLYSLAYTLYLRNGRYTCGFYYCVDFYAGQDKNAKHLQETMFVFHQSTYCANFYTNITNIDRDTPTSLLTYLVLTD